VYYYVHKQMMPASSCYTIGPFFTGILENMFMFQEILKRWYRNKNA